MSSCAAVDVNVLPQPGVSYGNGYELVLEFESVLNLPDRAKVVMEGTTVGVVTKVTLNSDRVDVTSRIDPNVVVPADIRASLQQATVLGDIYVALERPHAEQSATPPLGPDSIIPLAQTVSPPQVEDTIASLANFVSSGSIQRAQNTIIGINRVTPQAETARQIASRVAADLADLSNGIETVDQWLTGVAGTAQVLHNRIPTFQDWFSPKGMTGFDRLTVTAGYVGKLLPSVGSIYANGYWLVPLLESVADAMGAMQRDKRAFEAEVPAWRRLFYENFLPQDKYPAINITSILGPDGRELSGNVQDVLRIIGAAP
ncbi:mammalian cell entry protein [Mycolicibacter kumamotonensis]|uniref:Mammalian cell entry protein n=1 Tax=Mycolicibacter kumamotonensis TaxID=354243 RepID=A0A1B8SIN9_9MYCO|nr:mammalian cell entry protein [Mycolicibacter kumamotonensis]